MYNVVHKQEIIVELPESKLCQYDMYRKTLI